MIILVTLVTEDQRFTRLVVVEIKADFTCGCLTNVASHVPGKVGMNQENSILVQEGLQGLTQSYFNGFTGVHHEGCVAKLSF